MTEESAFYSRVEARLEKRFFGIFNYLGGFVAIIVALCGVAGTLMIESFTAKSRSEFEAARTLQVSSSNDLRKIVEQAKVIKDELNLMREELLLSRDLADNISKKTESLSKQNIEISQQLFNKISEIVNIIESSGINIDQSVSTNLTGLDKLIGEARDFSNAIPNASFQVGIVAYKTDNNLLSEFSKVIFEELLFTKRGVYLANERPSYLSSSNAVLYYDNSNVNMAEKIAEVAELVFSKKFLVMKGAGFGVTNKDRGGTIIVHIVENN